MSEPSVAPATSLPCDLLMSTGLEAQKPRGSHTGVRIFELPLGDAELTNCPKLPTVLESQRESREFLSVAKTATLMMVAQQLSGDSGKDQKFGLWAEGTLCRGGNGEKSK